MGKLKAEGQTLNSVVKDESDQLHKARSELETKIKESNQIINDLNKKVAENEKNIASLKLDIQSKTTMFADEKKRLEKLLADNKFNSEEEKNRIEKQHKDAIDKVKLEASKSAKVLKDLMAEKEQNIAEK